MSLSIRWRLTLWNLLALACVLAGFAALVYSLVSRALYQQLDRKLLAGVRQIQQDARLASDRDERLRHWLYELKEHENIAGAVYTSDGRLVERTIELAADSVPPTPSTEPSEPRFRDAAVPIVGRQRLLETGLDAGGGRLSVVLMAGLEDLDRELANLVAALMIAIPVGLAIGSGLSYLLARKALSPVEQLRRRTLDITADRLDRRLPVLNPADELGQLAETVNNMIGRLERSFAEARRFTADASHELRTPLTAIRTEVEVALTRTSLPAEQRQLLGSILEECDRLTRLTDQLLSLAREDAGVGVQAWEPTDLAAVLGGVVETMRPLAESQGKSLTFTSSGPVPVRGDSGRLRQVMYNLLDNAIRYTPEGGQIEARVEGHEAEAVVTVSDTGVGIPPEDLPHVFDRFYRVDKARHRDEGGTGLGLSIVRSIVSTHGGTVTMASTPGQGTTCTVNIPLMRGFASPVEGQSVVASQEPAKENPQCNGLPR